MRSLLEFLGIESIVSSHSLLDAKENISSTSENFTYITTFEATEYVY